MMNLTHDSSFLSGVAPAQTPATTLRTAHCLICSEQRAAVPALVVASVRTQNDVRLFLAARRIDRDDGAPHIVLALIVANLTVGETQRPEQEHREQLRDQE